MYFMGLPAEISANTTMLYPIHTAATTATPSLIIFTIRITHSYWLQLKMSDPRFRFFVPLKAAMIIALDLRLVKYHKTALQSYICVA